MINKRKEEKLEKTHIEESNANTPPTSKNSNDSLAFLANRSLFVPVVEIPSSVSDRVGLAFKYLVSKSNQNWSLVLEQLEKNGGFKGLPPKDVRKFVYQIPKSHLPPIITRIEHLHQEANMPVSPKLVNVFIDALSLAPTIVPGAMAQIEKYIEGLRLVSRSKRLSRDTYELLVRVYGKTANVDKMNAILREMKDAGLQPSKNTFENVLMASVYKAPDQKQAVEVFDTMKFLSQSTKPDERAYRSIIVSHVNNNDVEKALDLYNEMVSDKIDVSQPLLVALARGCNSRPELKVKAWEFIFEIYKHGWEPTIETLEYIVYLSAKDSDVALCRALVNKLSERSALTVRTFSFLMLAYAKSKIRNEEPSIHPILAHEYGVQLRRNILADSSYAPSSESSLPFLPVVDLVSDRELLAESSAMWAHANAVRPDLINTESANNYLNVAANFGSLNEFLDRYKSVTSLDRTGIPNTRTIIEKEEELQQNNLQLEPDNADRALTSPFLHLSQTVRAPRDDTTYLIALKAAGRARNYEFARLVWTERGLYRKSDFYKSKTRQEKDQRDFQFAAAMVTALTDMNLLSDALAILISTEFQFKWTWKELIGLYRAAGTVGRSDICRTVRGVAGRAQINFGGKIRKRDYKRYVMERGY